MTKFLSRACRSGQTNRQADRLTLFIFPLFFVVCAPTPSSWSMLLLSFFALFVDVSHSAGDQMIASDEQKKVIDNELMKVIASLSMLRGGDDEKNLDDLFLAVGIEKKNVDEMLIEYCTAVENFSIAMQEPYTRAQSAFNELRTQLSCITSTIGGADTMQLMEDLRANPLFMNLSAYQKCDVMKEHFKRRYADSITRIADEFMSQKRSKKLPESAIEVLKLWWHEHIMWPYPEVRRRLSHDASLQGVPPAHSLSLSLVHIQFHISTHAH